MIRMVTVVAALLALSACTEQVVKAPVSDRDGPADDRRRFVEIVDGAALELIEPSADIRILADGFLWTEGPLWVEQGEYLLFSDIPNNVIHKYEPGVGTSVYLERSGATGLVEGDSGQGSNGLLLDQQGRLVLMQQGDRRVAVMDAPLLSPSGQFKSLADRFDGKRLNSPNDGVLHSDGSLYFTDPPYGLAQSFTDPRKELAFQGVYRLSPQGELSLLDRTVTAPNGIALSLDEKTLYVAVSDESNPAWLAYDVAPDGSVRNKRVFIDAADAAQKLPGMPDGMAVHSSGAIFATGPGGVWLVSPDGAVLAKILTGKLTANCALSGDEKTLFMTAHDTLMSISLR